MNRGPNAISGMKQANSPNGPWLFKTDHFFRSSGRRLTEGRAPMLGRGRTTSCGGRHMVSCERLERSVRSVSCSRRFRIFDLDPNFRLAI